MIIKGLFNLVLALLKIIFAPINLPQLPTGIQIIFDTIIFYMQESVGLAFVFLRPATVRLLIPVVIILINFDKLWKGIIFILKKIPFLGIQ